MHDLLYSEKFHIDEIVVTTDEYNTLGIIIDNKYKKYTVKDINGNTTVYNSSQITKAPPEDIYRVMRDVIKSRFK